MTAERWQVVKVLFQKCIALDPPARSAFLASQAASDEIRAEVERLLRQMDEGTESFLVPPAAVLHAFRRRIALLRNGDTLSGRFRIDGFIGSGGMGEVYRARDLSLGEDIALKIVSADETAGSAGSARFRREVQLARRVTHPNVCRLFDLNRHESDGQSFEFLTMELLAGTTLKDALRSHGRFSKEEAKDILRQVLAGLKSAHESDVVHRDLKPANIMLVPSAGRVTRAVLMDFGLARTEKGTTETTLTSTGDVLGTLAYISPEQLSGDPITARTDLYSFGLIWYEMLEGERPFQANTTVADAMLRLRQRAPVSQTRYIPREWRAAIGSCLEPDSALRPAGADAVLDLLEENRTVPLGQSLRRYALHNRRTLIGAAAIAGISAGGVSLFPGILRRYKSNADLPAGTETLLSPIVNSTGNAQLNSVTELLRGQLAQSVHLEFIDHERLVNMMRQMGKPEQTTDPAAFREAAWRLNAPLAVFGNVNRIGADFALSVQIEIRGSQPQNPKARFLRSFSSSDPQGLMRSVRDASLWVRETAGEPVSTIAQFDRLPADATTPSWEALANFARGEEFFMRQDYETAILEFEAALRIDPKFTLAALRRADLLVSQHRQKEGFAQWRQAMELLKERPVTRPEELNARGMFAMDIGDFEASDRYFRTWSAEYPHEWKAPFYRMLPLVMNGSAAEAAEILNTVRRKVPDYGELYAELIGVYLVLGRPDDARKLLPELRKWNRPERATLREGFIRFREGDCAGCFEIYRELQKSDWRRGAADGMLYEALLLIDAGLPAAAADNTARFLASGSWAEIAAQQINLLIVQAWAEMLTGRPSQSLKHARQVLEGEDGPLIVSLAATIFARLGARREAEAALRICADFLDLPLYKIAWRRIRGELAAANGDRASALKEFRAAAALEPRIAHRQYLIEALPASDPERLELCRNVVRIPWQSAFRPPPLYSLGALSFAVPAVNDAGLDEPYARRFAASAKQLTQIV
jgi:serine/threonine protein kinase/tetratricopeptide (TPR) repeat protein